MPVGTVSEIFDANGLGSYIAAEWRHRFGDCQSRATNAGWPPDPEHHLHAYSHEQWSRYESEAVLQVAVRTLHPHYAANLGQAAYHALRLISNCCADNGKPSYLLYFAPRDTKQKSKDANKRIVLECGGIELLLRCANSRLWPEIVVAALWNICAESEAQPGVNSGSATENGSSPEVGPKMCTIACAQLSLNSTAECDDANGKSLLSAKIENGQRHKNIIKELLELAEVVEDKARKEMAADLLEKASCFGKSISTMQHYQAELVRSTVASQIICSNRVRNHDTGGNKASPT
jgi:hypothetical protein